MNKDFQNGLIVGLASKGKVKEKTVSFEKSNISVVQPVYANTEIVESNNVSLGVSVVLESEE